MADVIASGPERPEPRRRPPPWLIMLVVVAALAGAVRLWGGASPTPAAPTALPEPGPQTASPTPTPTGRPATFRLAGRPGSAPPGLRVLIGGQYADTADGHTGPSVVTGAGRPQPLPGVGPSTATRLVTVQRLPGATAILIQDGRYRSLSATIRPDRGPAVELGPGLDTVVAAHGGGVIAADSGWTRRPGRLVGYTPTGRLRWQRPLREATIAQRDTPYGLLVQVVAEPDNSSSGRLALVEARSGHLLNDIGAAEVVLASTDDKVAWIPAGCDTPPRHCSALAVTDLRTGRQQRYDLASGWPPSAAAFSPDGRTLAVSFAGQHDSVAQADPDGYVSVLSLDTHRSERMPGLTTGAKQAPTLGWDDDGDLVLGVNVDDEFDRLLLWDPGMPGPIVLPARLPPYTAATYLAVLPS